MSILDNFNQQLAEISQLNISDEEKRERASPIIKEMNKAIMNSISCTQNVENVKNVQKNEKIFEQQRIDIHNMDITIQEKTEKLQAIIGKLHTKTV